MRPAQGQVLFTYSPGACSGLGPIHLRIKGYLLGPSGSQCTGKATHVCGEKGGEILSMQQATYTVHTHHKSRGGSQHKLTFHREA